jgi:hypothetical protein
MFAITERYWQKFANTQKEEPFRITLADKNAPSEKVWQHARLL